jgi:hypothetical protein
MTDTTFWTLFWIGSATALVLIVLVVLRLDRRRPCVQPDTDPRRGPTSTYTPKSSPLGLAWGLTR